jgi:hypothetical protein
MRGIGLILRLVGPLLEVGCLWGMLQVRGRGYRVLGLDAETWCWAGIIICLGLVIAGNIMSRRTVRPKDRWDRPRGLDQA